MITCSFSSLCVQQFAPLQRERSCLFPFVADSVYLCSSHFNCALMARRLHVNVILLQGNCRERQNISFCLFCGTCAAVCGEKSMKSGHFLSVLFSSKCFDFCEISSALGTSESA